MNTPRICPFGPGKLDRGWSSDLILPNQNLPAVMLIMGNWYTCQLRAQALDLRTLVPDVFWEDTQAPSGCSGA